MLLNILVKVLDINDANDVIKTGDVIVGQGPAVVGTGGLYFYIFHISSLSIVLSLGGG